jgi:DNA-binding MarR family transcriptional regulator
LGGGIAYHAGVTEKDPSMFMLLNEIGIIEQLARNRFERAQTDGLRLPHFVVLNHLVRLGDGRMPGDIARALQLTQPTITNTLQRLEARGLIRLQTDPKDARAKRVFLTEAGRARREGAISAVTEDLSEVQRASGVAPETMLPPLRALRSVLDRWRDGD